jgi:hypothetical protein
LALKLQICCLAILSCIGCGSRDTGRQTESSDGRETAIVIDMPPTMVDEMSPATWTWGGFKRPHEDEISLAARPRVLQPNVSHDRFVLVERHRIRQLSVGGGELWRFDPGVTHPGALVDLESACRLNPDTLLVFDRNNSRLLLLHIGQAGAVQADLVPGTRLVPEGCSNNGHFLLASTTRSDESNPQISLQATTWPPSDLPNTIVKLPLPPERRLGWIQPSYGFTDSLVFVAHADSGLINLYSTAGRLVRVLRWPQPRIPLTRHLAETYFGADPTRPTSSPKAFVPSLDGPRMDYLPAFVEVRAEPGGFLWIRAPRVREDSLQEWYVVTNTGTAVAHWLLPEPTAARPTVLVGRVSGRPVFYHEDRNAAPFLRAISE